MSEVLAHGVRTKKCLTVRAVAVEDAVIKFFHRLTFSVGLDSAVNRLMR